MEDNLNAVSKGQNHVPTIHSARFGSVSGEKSGHFRFDCAHFMPRVFTLCAATNDGKA
jgi:hypothetical protein